MRANVRGRAAWFVATVAVIVATCSGPGAASPAVQGELATAPPTAAGPTSYTAWLERQGFGGSSGINQVVRGVEFVQSHPDATLFDLDDIATDNLHLIEWLDAHPATACWSAFHDAIRAQLVQVRDALAVLRADKAAGSSLDATEIAQALTAAQGAEAMPAPTACP